MEPVGSGYKASGICEGLMYIGMRDKCMPSTEALQMNSIITFLKLSFPMMLKTIQFIQLHNS